MTHLTHEQLCDLLLATTPPHDAEASETHDHLRNCPLCASEFANLQSSLSLFRETANSYSGRAFTQMQSAPDRLPTREVAIKPVHWAFAAAVVFLAAIIPLAYHPRHQPALYAPAPSAAPVHTTESDEALLEDIDQTLSAPIPSPMKPLADPTAGATSAQPTSNQRKN
jgi:hypothetical protein